jgi:alpha-tubulin suppressor-like RCC1 family protein
MCAGLNDGSVRCWGNNEHGQLGDGTTTNKDTPTAVSMVAIGANCAVTNPLNGNAGVGSDSCGGKTTLNVGESCAPGCDTGYTVPGLTTCSAAGDTSVATCAPVDVASGGDHSCASASFGEVTSCGLNDCDRLGNGEIDGSDVKRA